MNFCGIQLTTTLDYPGEIATILFTKGCNMKCGFCHNASIASWEGSTYYEKDILDKLMKRKDIIDHVVISGGEPSLYGQELIQFMRRLKNNDFKIKLDTNGTNPDFLYNVIRLDLIDYIAMDIKTILDKNEYSNVTGVIIDEYMMNCIRESVSIITNQFTGEKEFRTTIVKTYHSEEIMMKLADLGLPNHYFQQFVKSNNIFDDCLEKYTDSELKNIIEKINYDNKDYPFKFIKLRGI